jgi:curved DNA-binding protein CbpA
MPRESADPYAVLGLPPTATQDQITNAYRRQVRTLHPDVRTTSQPARPRSDEQLRRVLAAYSLLRDPERRARYDRAAMRRPTAPRAPAETTNTRNTAATVRIPGLTVEFRVRWLSD